VHIVTKILIVFCAVLSLLLAALTMSYAANASILRANVNYEKNAAATAMAEAHLMQTQSGKLQGDLELQTRSLQDMIASQVKEISTLESERTDLRSRVQQAQADADRGQSQIAQSMAAAQTQTALIKNYRDEVTTLRDQMLAREKREIELLDKISDLSSSREVLEQSARALKEQLEEIKLQNQSLQQAAAGGGAVTNMAATMPREMAGPLVRARVTKVFKNPAGEDMVVINEGSNRGIKENVLMNVSRNDGFVASIVITTVEPTQSVGRVSNVRTSPVQQDDVVLSRLN
jgi:hypothetical protein